MREMQQGEDEWEQKAQVEGLEDLVINKGS